MSIAGATSTSPLTFPQALYVHLPFCAALCTYCDFASEVYANARANRYLAALAKEFATRIENLEKSGPFAPKTIFLGGGTPSALSLSELATFFEILKANVNLENVEEFTIEANPGSTDAAKLEFLLQQGVNRISFGVQSFQPHLLQLLGRVHGAQQGAEAVRTARSAGFKNVSIDLMHGLPTQSLDDLKRDLERALLLGTDHLSAYGLIYEDGTPLKGAVERGVIARLTEDEEAAHYRLVMDTLESGGLPQYEISNYARPGFEARHNLVYWRNEAYLGVGVSAASCIAGERAVNCIEMDRYMLAAERDGWAIDQRETLDLAPRAREALILELRLREGVHPEEFRNRWGSNPLSENPAFAVHLQEKLLECTRAGRIRIPRHAMPLADGILAHYV